MGVLNLMSRTDYEKRLVKKLDMLTLDLLYWFLMLIDRDEKNENPQRTVLLIDIA